MATKSYSQKQVDFYEALRNDPNRQQYITLGDKRFAHQGVEQTGLGSNIARGLGGSGGRTTADVSARQAEYDEYISNNKNPVEMSNAAPENQESVKQAAEAERKLRGRASNILTGGVNSVGVAGTANTAKRVLLGA